MQRGGEKSLVSVVEEMAPGLAMTFHLILIAEEEIAAAILKAPDSAEALNGSFLRLQPSRIISGLSDELYRAYCRELLVRVVDGEPLDMATKAEMLVALSTTSLRAPLTRNALALYEILFIEIFGALPASKNPLTSPDYPGAEQEVLVDITRKLGRIRRSGPQ